MGSKVGIPVSSPSDENQQSLPAVVESEPDALLDSHMRTQFAHAVAFGVPIPHALTQAGFTNATPALGYALLKNEEVMAIVDEDRTWMREKMKISQEQIIAQLDNDRSFAYACENAGAAVAATMAKAKIVGIADPHSGKGAPKRVIIEWDEDGDSTVPLLAADGAR